MELKHSFSVLDASSLEIPLHPPPTTPQSLLHQIPAVHIIIKSPPSIPMQATPPQLLPFLQQLPPDPHQSSVPNFPPYPPRKDPTALKQRLCNPQTWHPTLRMVVRVPPRHSHQRPWCLLQWHHPFSHELPTSDCHSSCFQQDSLVLRRGSYCC